MKKVLTLFVVILSSCASTPDNSFLFRTKATTTVDMYINNPIDYDFKIDKKYDTISNLKFKIDSLISKKFEEKNVKISKFKKSRFKIEISKFIVAIEGTSKEVFNRKLQPTGQIGDEVKIKVAIYGTITDTKNYKVKKIEAVLEDIKIAHTDLIFDFFAVDSSNDINIPKLISNTLNAFTNRTVKFINKNYKK